MWMEFCNELLNKKKQDTEKYRWNIAIFKVKQRVENHVGVYACARACVCNYMNWKNTEECKVASQDPVGV